MRLHIHICWIINCLYLHIEQINMKKMQVEEASTVKSEY